MSKLTAAEQKWLDKVQKILNECPSDRLGFYTIGDKFLHIYDLTKFDEINKMEMSTGWYWPAVIDRLNAGFDYYLQFPSPVESVSG
ncbi:hypothetical protein [Xenorhabdus bovienii]|uniref:hypothetical protein n=1 Tax=Xenorhabdus bovienii TaxID=40576 RepID=UPI0023B2A5FC|nr:hypothetical protein [Xenorhabdus bovienii]MDE9544184.1 hypothetical protein [Xenorhabdus bovienii]